MSKQLNFFIHPDELKTIDVFFKANECILIQKNVPKNNVLLEAKINSDDKKQFQVYITNDRFRSSINKEYLQTKDIYYIDILSSCAIEFSLGGFYPYSDKELHRSRLYFVTEYYKDGRLVKKSPEFIKWGENLLKDFRKQFLVKSALSSIAYFSKQFLEWVNTNNAMLDAAELKFSLPPQSISDGSL